MSDLLVLDVGCGSDPRGTVNCDLYVDDMLKHRGENVADKLLKVHEIKNFVVCDAQWLPFQDNVFDLVFSAQVIEHVPHPFLMFKELVRVSRKTIIVETMHRLGEAFSGQKSRKAHKWFKEHHVNKFNIRSLNAYGKACYCKAVKNYIIHYFYFPHIYLCIFKFPTEIGVKFEKVQPIINAKYCTEHKQVFWTNKCPECQKREI